MWLPKSRPWCRRIVVISVAISFGVGLGNRVHQAYFGEFDPVAWGRSDAFERYRMLPALARSSPLIGRARDEVTARLGRPDFIAGTYLTDDGADYVILTPTYDGNGILIDLDIPTREGSVFWSIIALPSVRELVGRWRLRNVPDCRF